MSETLWKLRLATAEDIPQLESLIERSVRSLLPAHYAADVVNASLGTAFGVDSQLIRDGSYFVAEAASAIVGCGGWSRRATTYGADRARVGEDPALNPSVDPARIRAFFVDPAWTRRGIGRAILLASEAAAAAAGFRNAMMIATLAGERLYEQNGYEVEERFDAPLPGGQVLAVVRMSKELAEA